ncbi:MAG: glucosaminidase domain-containing protein [Snowella sp.]|nr:glucosaminidase domain-containing protein [Snowella sp.]
MARRLFLKELAILVISFFSVVARGKSSLARQVLSDASDRQPPETLPQELMLAQKPKLTFPPVPADDPDKGFNTNAHLPGIPEPIASEKQAFIKEITQYALPLEKQYGVPACVITAIAAFETNFGHTRIAYYANNLFKLKYINRKKGCHDGSCENIKTYQLVGQPNEIANTAIIISESYGDNRFVFDESRRFGNRYRVFDSYQDSVNFLVTEVWLKKEDYKAALEKYQANLKTLGASKAASQFLLDLATEGFTITTPQTYQNNVTKIMDEWKLCPS